MKLVTSSLMNPRVTQPTSVPPVLARAKNAQSSSRELVAEPWASEGGPDTATTIKAFRTDELLSEPTSGDLAETSASPVTVGASSMEPVEVSTTVEGVPKDIVEEAIGAMSVMTSAPFGNAIVICK